MAKNWRTSAGTGMRTVLGHATAAAAVWLAASAAQAQAPKAAAPAPSVVASGQQGVAAPAQPDVVGVWVDHTRRGAIEILPCGTRVCGYVYWVKDPTDRQGKTVLDTKNPDAARRGKPMCGTQILGNLTRQGPAKVGYVWGAGSIYNPEEGASFDAEIKLISPNELSVLGYIGMKFMGESFTWTRAPAELARCGPARV